MLADTRTCGLVPLSADDDYSTGRYTVLVRCNARERADLSSPSRGVLVPGQRIEVIEITDAGWAQHDHGWTLVRDNQGDILKYDPPQLNIATPTDLNSPQTGSSPLMFVAGPAPEPIIKLGKTLGGDNRRSSKSSRAGSKQSSRKNSPGGKTRVLIAGSSPQGSARALGTSNTSASSPPPAVPRTLGLQSSRAARATSAQEFGGFSDWDPFSAASGAKPNVVSGTTVIKQHILPPAIVASRTMSAPIFGQKVSLPKPAISEDDPFFDLFATNPKTAATTTKAQPGKAVNSNHTETRVHEALPTVMNPANPFDF
eukprot:gb/GEZN01007848.1/.p1 GENE.gb/GEZN01007848.1/~~gb/GEZN01007848.1/.p1  ORF type:complete len:313 (+),score=18.02 gb/GEZN01007848.1/:55-993(+)